MKFTLSWLKDHLETSASLTEIAEALTAIGLEVEDVQDPAEKLKAFKVAYVVEAVQHPNADKLRVCKVDAGEGIVQVVCGAPNARTGMKGVFAPPGTYVPGTDLLLKPTKIRGVESMGMLCSGRELEISDDHDGIIELPESAAVGTPAAPLLGSMDPMIHINITPNRPDCLGVYGIARDLAAKGLGRLKAPDALQGVSPVAGEFPCPIPIGLDFGPEDASACPVFAGRVVRGVKNGASPKWLQDRLKAIGLRPISALVDITNYISFDRGRPLHVYDADKIRGRIYARLGRSGETLLALDGKTYEIAPGMCVIADDTGPLGLAGVMGGAASGSTEATGDVFIESAYFDPGRTARTGRALAINSDARYRFERGVDPAFVLPGLELATRMVLDLCGGTASGIMVAGSAKTERRALTFHPGEVERLTGVRLEPGETSRILTDLGFAPERDGAHLKTQVPTWRPDIGGATDLVEEVVRIAGFDRIASVPLASSTASGAILTARQKRRRLVKRVLAARGLMEAVTWSFISDKQAELFGAPQGGGAVRLVNPISSEMSTMRPSLLPGLLAALGRNLDRGQKHVALFEVGQQFAGDAPEDQAFIAAGLRAGLPPRHWSGPRKASDWADAKADCLESLAAIGAPQGLQIAEDAPSWYHPGRSGTLRLGPKARLAAFGELHPRTLKAFGLEGPVAAFEIYLDAVPEAKAKGAGRGPLDAPELLALERDFAFLVAKHVRADDVLRAVRGADKALITEASVFDVYEGKGVPEGSKSLAVSVVLQPREKTLTDADIEAVMARIVGAVTKATGASLRA